MAEEQDKNLDKPREPPVSPQHPDDDAMPPYSPGGVPEPSGDGQEPAGEIEERKVPPSGFPPKRAP